MLGVMLQKLWHKKWMVVCLLIGSILLTATVVSFPMYRTAAFDRMLQDELEQVLTEDGEWPGLVEMVDTIKYDVGGRTMQGLEDEVRGLYRRLGVTEKSTVLHYSLQREGAASLMQREDLGTPQLRLAMMSDLPEHAELLAGEMYSEDGVAEDGSIEVVISQECMVSSSLLLGETLEFETLSGTDGNRIRIRIVGVYGKRLGDDFYWHITPEEMTNVCLMNERIFRDKFMGENAGKYSITCSLFALFEYGEVKASEAEGIYEKTKQLAEEYSDPVVFRRANYLEALESFGSKRTRIEATLFILQVPVLVLLCAFLFMISAQMYEMERNEISVLKSRGSSGSQIFRLYLYQSVFLTLAGEVPGLLLGALFGRILGSARNFLEFDITRRLNITYGRDVVLYALAAAAASVLIMTLPAIRHSRLTIIRLKQQRVSAKRPLWEKCFADIICLAIGIYGYYNFSANEKTMVDNVLRGESLDPLLYLCSSLFIVGAGLLFLRLQPLLVRLIYLLGRKFWGPASYASFMENIRNGRKQQFIMLFLILTISLGMYHATVARTILQNALDNEGYLNGADLIMKDVWQSNTEAENTDGRGRIEFYEPDYFKYGLLENVASYTKVLYDDGGYVTQKKNARIPVTVMGIHTKEFGENAHMPEGLQEKHFYEYLNELAVVPGGVLVTRNFQTLYGYAVGDYITFYDSYSHYSLGKIVDFVDYWPGYEPVRTVLNADGSVGTKDNCMIIAHYQELQQKWGTMPYEVWLSSDGKTDSDAVYRWIQETDTHLLKYVNRQDRLEKVMEDPLLQGTNGVLTMGFIVMMLLCAVGYLIYWVMSIRSRELMFGVLRACGMYKGELFHMLLNEQLFSGVFSVLAGIGIGKITSKLFVPILQTAYAASNQVLPMQLITNRADMVRLYGVILGTMAVCLIVLIVLVFHLNVSKALKLGEE